MALLDIKDKYTGTTGNTHGEKKDSSPAVNADSNPISIISLQPPDLSYQYFSIILIIPEPFLFLQLMVFPLKI